MVKIVKSLNSQLILIQPTKLGKTQMAYKTSIEAKKEVSKPSAIFLVEMLRV